MVEARIFAQQTGVGRTSEGNFVGLRGTRDGAMFSADWMQALVLEGRGFSAESGTATTPIVMVDQVDGTTDLTLPSFLLAVPNNAVVIPTYLRVTVEATVALERSMDTMAVASSVYDGDVTATGLTIVNMRTDAPVASLCTASGKVTATGTSPYTGNNYEFWRPHGGAVINSAAAAAGGWNYAYEWSAKEASVPPIIVGEGSLSIYNFVYTDANSHFIGAQWIELPEGAVI